MISSYIPILVINKTLSSYVIGDSGVNRAIHIRADGHKILTPLNFPISPNHTVFFAEMDSARKWLLSLLKGRGLLLEQKSSGNLELDNFGLFISAERFVFVKSKEPLKRVVETSNENKRK